MKFEDLVVGHFNEMAVKASEMVIETPGRDYPVLIIQGSLGSGKSSLIKAIEKKAANTLTVKSNSGTSVMNEMINSMRDQTFSAFFQMLETVDLLIIDDIQELSNRTGTQDVIRRAIHRRIENKKQTIIATSKPIDEVEGICEELVSFLMSALVVEIQEPCFEDRLLIAKQFAKNRNISLYDDVAKFIADSCKKNFREIDGAILKLEAASKILKKEITLDFAKEYLRSKAFKTRSCQIKISEVIEEKLREFDIDCKIVNIIQGPVVNTFELELGPGIKISSVTNRTDDISLALMGNPIRMIYPMKDKSTIGVEVANNPRDMIHLNEIAKIGSFKNSKFSLPVIMGKDTGGNPSIFDLASAPHFLIAGTTGAGKSAFIHSLIYSLITTRGPDKVRLMLIDPKQLELMLFKNLPHLLAPMITDPQQVTQALDWVIEEMERRCAIFKDYSVKNIDDFHKTVNDNELPKIVIVIDEYADLVFSKSGRTIETSISRLAAKGHGSGIHIVLATQRPTTDVLTGIIKTNFPTRVAFRVFTNIDSRVILDLSGAEKLLGKGDMLFKQGIDIQRLHAAYVNEDEIEELVENLEESPKYDKSLMGSINKQTEAPSFDDDTDPNKLYDEAVSCVSTHRVASASFLQRRLGIGYHRAAGLIEEMEQKEIIGPAMGSKPRKVLVPMNVESNYSDKTALIRKTPISDIISRFIPLTKTDENFIATCPFHSDDKQSLKLNDEKGFFKCFVCGAGGDSITFVKDFKKIDFKEALKEIIDWKV